MDETTTIYVGSDHAGYSLKKILLESFKKDLPQFRFEDCGTHNESSCDYPDFAKKVAENVVQKQTRGILICGTGIGMSIAANKIDGVRAAEIWDATSARLSREHNNANVACIGARLVGPETALEACRTWLKTEFLGGRHQGRIDKISALERSRS